MDGGETAQAAAQTPNDMESTPHIPYELVTVILSHLPVESLIRFSGVCKSWRSTISRDPTFHRAHLRLQKPFLLVSPRTLEGWKVHTVTNMVILYRWDDSQQYATLPVVHATDLSSEEEMHRLVHCDGLVLLSSKATVRVINPATRRTLTLPWSTGAESPCPRSHIFSYPQSFGLGHDPRSDVYKVARFFYRSIYMSPTGSYGYATGMEVFTIGTDRQWRETTKDPPYPVPIGKPAIFFKGSLVWTIDECILGHTPPGLLRFSLEDEAFGVMPPPPHYHERSLWCSLAELRGELCLALEGADVETIDMWMCDNIKNPQWDPRYTINVSTYRPRDFNPVAIFDDEIVFKVWFCDTRRYNLKTETYTDMFHMNGLGYQDPITGMLGYEGRQFDYFDVIPYTPSLIQI